MYVDTDKYLKFRSNNRQQTMQKKIYSRISAAFIVTIALFALSGCGNDSRVPTDGSLLVGTSTVTVIQPLPLPVGVSCSGIVNGVGTATSDFIIKVTTLDPNGDPAGKLDVQISADFAENTTGFAFTAVFITDVGKKIDTLISSTNDTAPFTATTDELGELFLKLRLDTTYGDLCLYAGQLKVSSGVHTSQVKFAVEKGT